MAEVTLDRVAKVYANGVQAVRDLSLRLRDGELLVLVGPSGCGKTTTLRLIAGLEEPTWGSIAIGGHFVNNRPPRERDVAMVFQRPALYPHLNVRDNLAFGGRLRLPLSPMTRWLRRVWLGRSSQGEGSVQDLAERVTGVARTLGLASVLERYPGQLSGGQQQRVALGRALVRRPAVFLLDEPLSNLDARLRGEMRRELHLLQRRLRATMVYVTHDPVEALALGDRVAVLEHGCLQQEGSPTDLYARPANRFVAGFLGWPPMNLLDGRLDRAESRHRFTAEGWSVAFPATAAVAEGVPPGQPVTLGLRPEAIRLAASGPEAATLTMEVALIEDMGPTRLVTLRRGGSQVTARLEPGCQERCGPIVEGQCVDVTLEMRQSYWFDAATGAALANGRPAG
jgi:ABC-type sugar transport system ATPase subunit